ncbi:DNA (cytosine-5-)-methyltransferase [Gordonia sp. N1V]|uniref:DNA cytosine methyltransferase n=1 Tax=Gordonia sp. N1V TaxID=3034163 RepID=UPI0023E2A2E7|nr:DNA (cytosine-5-)-methyltransferase [Gordonia sp. N1V]MDF3280882.1 DNA (cytosine-5-)-methyltransferase [Gordonia sp. N1V]
MIYRESADVVVGCLFSGYGGLSMAVNAYFGSRTAWFVEFDSAPSRILDHHWPNIPNHGDITSIDWSAVEPVDILCGGFPCQDVSAAGRRAGIREGTRSGLWSHFAEAINQLKPRIVVIENVRGLLSAAAHRPVESEPDGMGDSATQSPLRALGAVLGDLSDLGYDAQWTTIAAADVGACHRRERVFILATPADTERGGWDGRTSDAFGQPVGRTPVAGSGEGGDGGTARLLPTLTVKDAASSRNSTANRKSFDGVHVGDTITDALTKLNLLPTPKQTDHKHNSSPAERERRSPSLGAVGALLPTPRASDTNGAGVHGDGGLDLRSAALLPTPCAADGTGGGQEPARRQGHSRQLIDYALEVATDWGDYEPAIRRAELACGRPVPPPTEPNRNGNPRLSSRFAEWMMMLSDGHVTGVGLSRNEELKALGNGVVPAQALHAMQILYPIAVRA